MKQKGYELSPLGRFLGFIRYNTFIVCYPIGALGEAIVLWNVREIVYAEKFMSLEMPNPYNFTFRLGDLMTISPVIYFVIFP